MQCEVGETGIELREADNRKRFRLRTSLSISFLSCEMEIFFFFVGLLLGFEIMLYSA